MESVRLFGEYCTVAVAADYLGLTVQRVHAIVQSGQLKSVRITKMFHLIPVNDLRVFGKLERISGQKIEFRDKPRRRAS
jgi:hypothetical protein